MRQRKFKPAKRKTERRWRVPPALTHGEDVFEGLSVLEEVNGELGLLLWQSLRDALLWGQASIAERTTVFTPGAEPSRLAAILAAGAPAAVEPALRTLARMLGSAADMREENVSLACREVSEWADGQGLLAVSLAFAQAAAIVTPGDAAGSYQVARLARRRAEHARAESWYRRTIALARQAGDWSIYSLSFVGLGQLYTSRGNFPAARRFYTRALRAASRNSLWTVVGLSHHGLFVLEAETGRVDAAEEQCALALRAYGPGHPRLPALAQDLASFWIDRGNFAQALPVLRAVAPKLLPRERVVSVGGIARAAGNVGDADRFHEAWAEALQLLQREECGEGAAQALLDLARGASALGLWHLAERAGQRALELAEQRNEGKSRLLAESVLETVQRERTLRTHRDLPLPDAGTVPAPLTEELIRSLGELTPA
ncbi:MAG TPA: tetratricopeptide repeat protein [Longimicrobiaceae bacterium]|nr:tetratricopeptide repeat protein [Longimicrobiaceae bacterium]